MMIRKKLFQILIPLGIVLLLLLSLKVYYVRTDSRGELFWNAEDAYFFIGVADRGYRFSYLGYLVEQVRETFPFGASSPRENHCSVLVLHVTADSVQRYPIDNFWLGSIEPFQGALYAANLLPGGRLTKWSGTHFERPEPEELTRYYAETKKLPPGPRYDNVAGWSKRTVAGDVIRESATTSVEKDSKVTIKLDGKPLTFVMNSGFVSYEAYIDLGRPGQAPERIWSLDEQSHRVSRKEYEQIFKDHEASK